ncbi:MAG: hypothetical protein CO164_02245 [Rhodocyclales bacterium CG_4_9_14_3_um_filter_68_10]|nr:MAG: hypothetical protein CO164_02245 [Rhodocyclales bacterium CG_4_9_14_3_um_filter_68_10]
MNAAICVQRGSISSPNRLSRSTASMATSADICSSAARVAASIGSANTRKCPLPMQGSSSVMCLAALGHPSNVPAAGRHGFPSSRTKRK